VVAAGPDERASAGGSEYSGPGGGPSDAPAAAEAGVDAALPVLEFFDEGGSEFFEDGQRVSLRGAVEGGEGCLGASGFGPRFEVVLASPAFHPGAPLHLLRTLGPFTP
jgi:hypothetical protein